MKLWKTKDELRDDHTARRMRLSQAIKPEYYLGHTDEHSHSKICSIRDEYTRFGWINLATLEAVIWIERDFEEPTDESDACEMLEETFGEWVPAQEWESRGWSHPEVGLHHDESGQLVLSGEFITRTQATSIKELSSRLHWAFNPNSSEHNGLTIKRRGQ